MALVLQEFALVLHTKQVLWRTETESAAKFLRDAHILAIIT